MPLIPTAIEIVQKADIFVVVGTSMQAYPAASFIQYIASGKPIFFIDPKPTISKLAFQNLTIMLKGQMLVLLLKFAFYKNN